MNPKKAFTYKILLFGIATLLLGTACTDPPQVSGPNLYQQNGICDTYDSDYAGCITQVDCEFLLNHHAISQDDGFCVAKNRAVTDCANVPAKYCLVTDFIRGVICKKQANNLCGPLTNNNQVSTSDFMQAIKTLAEASNADFDAALADVEDKYQKLGFTDQSQLHEATLDSKYIFYWLFEGKITRKVVDLVERIRLASSDQDALLNNLSNGRKPIEALVDNSNVNNEDSAVLSLFKFFIENDSTSIKHLKMEQKHKIFDELTYNHTRKDAYLSLTQTDKTDYLKDAFLKDKSSVVKKILGSLGSSDEEARSLLVTEATKLAKDDLTDEASDKLNDLLGNLPAWGLAIDDSFDVNNNYGNILELIVDNLKGDLADQRVRDLISRLALSAQAVRLSLSLLWEQTFANPVFDIIKDNSTLSRKDIRMLLHMEAPYQVIIDGLNTQNLAAASARLNEFLAANVEEDIKEFADLDLGAGKKAISVIAELPANQHTSSMFNALISKLKSININYVRNPYGTKTLLQILAGEDGSRSIGDEPPYLRDQLVTLFKMGALMSDLGNDSAKVLKILTIIRGSKEACKNAFATIATIDLALILEATKWAFEHNTPSSWYKMYERGDGNQKLVMRSYLLSLYNSQILTFISKMAKWGLSLTEIYELGIFRGTLIKVLVASRANEDELKLLYSSLFSLEKSALRDELLLEAFNETPDIHANSIVVWVYERLNKINANNAKEAFKKHLQSLDPVNNQIRIQALKEKLREFVVADGLLEDLKREAGLWGLDENDDIFKARAAGGLSEEPKVETDDLGLNEVEKALQATRQLVRVENPVYEKSQKYINLVREVISQQNGAQTLINTKYENEYFLYFALQLDLDAFAYQALEEVFANLTEEETKAVINRKSNFGTYPFSLLFWNRGKLWDVELLKVINLLTDKGANASVLTPMQFHLYIKNLLGNKSPAVQLKKMYSNLSNKEDTLYVWMENIFKRMSVLKGNNVERFELATNANIYFKTLYKALDEPESQKVFKEALIKAAAQQDFSDYQDEVLKDIRILISDLDFEVGIDNKEEKEDNTQSTRAEQWIEYINNSKMLSSLIWRRVESYFNDDGQDLNTKVNELINVHDEAGNTILHTLAKRDPQDEGIWNITSTIINRIAAISEDNLIDFVNKENAAGKSALALWLEPITCNESCAKAISELSLAGAKILPWNLDAAINQLDAVYRKDADYLDEPMKNFPKEKPVADRLIDWLIDKKDDIAKKAIKKYVTYLRSIADGAEMLNFLQEAMNSAALPVEINMAEILGQN